MGETVTAITEPQPPHVTAGQTRINLERRSNSSNKLYAAPIWPIPVNLAYGCI